MVEKLKLGGIFGDFYFILALVCCFVLFFIFFIYLFFLLAADQIECYIKGAGKSNQETIPRENTVLIKVAK